MLLSRACCSATDATVTTCDESRSQVGTLSDASRSAKMSSCSVGADEFPFPPNVPIFSRAVMSVSFSAMRLIRLARRLFCLTVSSTRLSSTFSARPAKTSATEESPVNLIRLASRLFSSLSFFTIASANPVLNGSSS